MPGIPAGVTSISPTIKHYQQIWYDKVAVENWKANTPYYEAACDLRPMPKRSGRTIQLFGYIPYGASNAKASEGLTGPSLPLSSVTNQIYLDQYVDYISFSDVAVDTFIDPVVANGATELAYRGALTVNQVVVSLVDASVSIDSSTQIDLADNEFMNSATVRRCEFSLAAQNVKRRANAMYTASMHPLVAYDFFQDNSAGGMTDVLKRMAQSEELFKSQGGDGYQVVDWAGVRVVSTTTVPTYSNFPSSGKTGYGTHIFGKEAFFASQLSGDTVPKDKKYTVRTSYFTEATPDNAALQVAAAVSYNFLFGVAPRPNTNGKMGFRRIRCEVSII